MPVRGLRHIYRSGEDVGAGVRVQQGCGYVRGKNVGDGKRRDSWKCGSADGEYGARESEARFWVSRGRGVDKSVGSKCSVPKEVDGTVFSFREGENVRRNIRSE